MSADGESERHPIPQVEGYHCFACGTANPVGLKMSFYVLGDEVRSDVELAPHFVGWENMAHGGVVSAMLDEIMAWTVLHFRRAFCVTREITVKYWKPVPVGVPLTASGRILPGQKRTYAVRVEGEIRDGSGTVLAQGEADFALLRAAQRKLLPENVQAEMDRFMEALEAGEILGDGC